MNESNWIHGDNSRIFLNTALGCSSACSYCYLPQMGIPIGTREYTKISGDILIERLSCDSRFVRGRYGTIISIGCFSECWDMQNREQTRYLIRQLLPLGNPVQLATKRAIEYNEAKLLRQGVDWLGQLTVFVSCATITQWKIYEQGTPPPKLRFQGILHLKEQGIPAYLYIKPVIDKVTLSDIQHFAHIIQELKIDVVVGEKFSLYGTHGEAPIGFGQLLYELSEDKFTIEHDLKDICKVYQHSIDAVNFWRYRDDG